jgi:hypothetical protein
MMLTKEEGTRAVHIARAVIEQTVEGKQLPKQDNVPAVFKQNHGAFVTLHTASNHLLRGCIGIPESIMPLHKAITDAARSVTHDPRFPPLSVDELPTILIEVSILSPPERIHGDHPKDYPAKISIGKDGLIVEKGFYKGLLLPQVPVEQEWDEETFLSQTCLKAGLPPDAWIDRDTKIYHFTGQIFSETEPNGAVEEKTMT